MDQSKKSYEEKLEKHRTRVEYRKELVENLYKITLRYDRTMLAVAGGGTALLATQQSSSSATLPLSIPILLFISGIAFIMISLYLGAKAHEKIIDNIGKIDFDNDTLYESSRSLAGLWSNHLTTLSLVFIVAGLIAIAYNHTRNIWQLAAGCDS